MTKANRSTARRRPTTEGTAEAPAAPHFIDPTTLPAEYAMRVRGECMAPAIKGGDAILVDQRQPYGPGDLVCVFLKPEHVPPGNSSVALKRLVFDMMPGMTFPYQAHPDSNVMPVLVCEQDNPHRQYSITADKILAVHRCMGLVPEDVRLHDPATGEPQYKRAVAAGFSRRDLLAGVATVVPVAGLAAVPALASAADLAGHPDAELLELGRQYDAVEAKIWGAFQRINSIKPGDTPEPVVPEALKVRSGDKELGIPEPFQYSTVRPDSYGFREVDELRRKPRVKVYRGPITLEKTEFESVWDMTQAALAYMTARDEPWPEAQARADEIVAAHDAYMAALNSGGSEAIAEAEDEIDALNDEAKPISEAIVATRAVTLDGMMVKARAFQWLYPDDPEEMEPSNQHATDENLLRSIVLDLLAMRTDMLPARWMTQTG